MAINTLHRRAKGTQTGSRISAPTQTSTLGFVTVNLTPSPNPSPTRSALLILLRLHRHPIMIRLIMWLFDGLPLRFNRADLEKFCQEKAMVILRPGVQV
jgi:hypothetical protein